jgi:hypothetical protein
MVFWGSERDGQDGGSDRYYHHKEALQFAVLGIAVGKIKV